MGAFVSEVASQGGGGLFGVLLFKCSSHWVLVAENEVQLKTHTKYKMKNGLKRLDCVTYPFIQYLLKVFLLF